MHLHIANATIHLSGATPPALINQAFRAADKPAQAAAMNMVTPPSAGEYWAGQGGRFICTQPALMGLPTRHLVFSEGEADDLIFGPYVDVPEARSQIDGAANTAALLAANKAHAAARWAAGYSADGHSDFHLPSRLDLLMAYICAPQLFQKSGYYWSSTQVSRGLAFVQDFENGGSGWLGKDGERRVRACRWIHLNA